MKLKEQMLRPGIYRRAAEMIDSNSKRYTGFACHAILCVAVYAESGRSHKEAFTELFFPPKKIAKAYGREEAWGDLWGDTQQERQDCRVLALLFMSEIAKGMK